MTTIIANKKPLGATILCASTLWSLDNKSNLLSYNRVINQLIPNSTTGNQFGPVSYNLETAYRPVPKPLYELASCEDFSGLLLYVGLPTHTIFGYKGSNQTGDGDIVLFYDINQNFIRAEHAPPAVKKGDRFYFTGSFTIDSNVNFILFGGQFGAFSIEQITLT